MKHDWTESGMDEITAIVYDNDQDDFEPFIDELGAFVGCDEGSLKHHASRK